MEQSDSAPAGPRRKLSREHRRVQLIEATIATLAARGYAGTTLGEVARTAGVSHGLANFHFETKDRLLAATLDHLSDEYRENWQRSLAACGASAPERIAALLRADFDPAICTPARLSAWCAFWGESQSRPLYLARCSANDAEHAATLAALCARMNAEHGYAGDPVRTARVLRVTVEGIWLDLMTMAEPYPVSEALTTVWTCAAAFYPRDFGPHGPLASAGPQELASHRARG
ncbi:MAG: TetR family transcriptional regulator C-terminal domain-containing protein [Thermohalobaculum sp.]|nr:TetR family transcriptional regulator C-terminal domain-containing protein [Thermohalobaculum sp.]